MPETLVFPQLTELSINVLRVQVAIWEYNELSCYRYNLPLQMFTR